MAGLREALRVLARASAPSQGEMNALRMFAGPMAKTADHAALSRAQEMATSGAARDDIWRETGWFQGVDGKWRFEIDDSTAPLRRTHAGNASGQLDQALDHPALYEAYPELRRTPYTIYGDMRPSGSYRPRIATTETVDGQPRIEILEEPAIVVRGANVGSQRNTTLHEVQHSIQDIEGFARGGMPGEFKQQQEAVLARDALSWRRELAKMREKMPAADWIAVENAVVHEYQKLGAMDWLPSREVRDLARDTVGHPDKALAEFGQLYGTDTQVTPLTGRQIYDRLGGEVEARNVQARRKMSAKQRRSTPPWQTQDTPDERQIVRYNSNGASNAVGDVLRVSAGLGGAALAGDITLRELLREQRRARTNPAT